MANSVVKDLFIEEMVSSGRDPEEAEQDWLQYLEDMADYRAHKYGNDIEYVSDQEFWGDEDGDVAPHTDGKAADREYSPYAKPDSSDPDWDEIPF